MPRYLIGDPKFCFNTDTRQIENSKTEKGIPIGEPVMLFRAQDSCVLPMLEAYFSECQRQNVEQQHLQSIMERIHEIRMWQRANVHKVKRPD